MEDQSLIDLQQAPFLLNGVRVEPSAKLLSSSQGQSPLEPKIMALFVALRPGADVYEFGIDFVWKQMRDAPYRALDQIRLAAA